MPFGYQDYAPLSAYLTSRSDGWWIALTASNGDEPGASPSSLDIIDPSEMFLVLAYVEQPPPPTITSPPSSSTVATATVEDGGEVIVGSAAT